MALSKLGQRVLLRATKLIGNQEAWIRGAMFGTKYVNKKNNVCQGETDMDRYCAIGAIRRAVAEETGDVTMTNRKYPKLGPEALKLELQVRNAVNRQLPEGGCSIPGFNDTRAKNHAAVKKLFCDTVKAEVTDGD